MEDFETHPVHLSLSEKEVEMYFSLFDERIKRLHGQLQRIKDTVYEINVKKDMKMDEISEKLYMLENMYDEMREQSAW